jgi:ClpX C4-type zinc finger protein
MAADANRGHWDLSLFGDPQKGSSTFHGAERDRLTRAEPMQRQTEANSRVRCGFCGKSPADVRTILTSGESAICDECVSLAMDTLGRESGNVIIRIAYFAFRCVALFAPLVNRRGRK